MPIMGMTTIFPITIQARVFAEMTFIDDDFLCAVMERLIPKIHMLMGIAAWPICYNKTKWAQVSLVVHRNSWDLMQRNVIVPHKAHRRAIPMGRCHLGLSNRPRDLEAAQRQQ